MRIAETSMSIQDHSQLETDQVSKFFSAWCLCQFLALCVHWPQQRKFYDWFSGCDLSESKRRGLGTYGYSVFGCIQVPHLSAIQLRVVAYLYGGVLMAGFLKPGAGLLHLLGLILSVLYHGSLWAERASSHHREILSITLWMYLCLAPDLLHASAVFRLHICSIYTMSLVQKMVTSILRGQSWSKWSLHAFLWKSMWAKPYFPTLQRLIFLHPSIAHFGGWMSVVCELGPLLSLFFPVQCLAYLALIGMHVAVIFIQGIDYVSYWTPALLVGVFCTKSSVLELILSLVSSGSFALVLLGAQLLFAFTTANFFNINLPPLMSCPMFVTIARLDDKCHQQYVMTLETEIPYERIEWMYPFVKPEYGMGLLSSDVKHFPMPFVAFGWGGSLDGAPTFFHRYFVKDFTDGFYLMTNVTNFPEELRWELQSIVMQLHGETHWNRGPSPYSQLKSLAERCQAARAAFVAHAQQKHPTVKRVKRVKGPRISKRMFQRQHLLHCQYKPRKIIAQPRHFERKW